MENNITAHRNDIYVLACKHRLLNGSWKIKLQTEVFQILDQYHNTNLEAASKIVKSRVKLVMSRTDENLFKDLKICCTIIKEAFQAHSEHITQTWVSDLWKFVDNLLECHYDLLLLKNGAEDIRANSFKYRGIRQDLANFHNEWHDYNFGITSYRVTREDYFQEVIMLLDFAVRLYRLKY